MDFSYDPAVKCVIINGLYNLNWPVWTTSLVMDEKCSRPLLGAVKFTAD